MAFFGLEFTLDSISSSDFGLFISTLDGSGLINSPMGSSVNLVTKKLLRNPIEYLYGVEIGPCLEFDLDFNSATPISADSRNIISQWLLGSMNYRKLKIIQSDLENVYFNVIITSATATYIGNVHYGWRCHLKSDSPFAYEYPRNHSRAGSSGILNETVNIENVSATQDYVYPMLTFSTNGIGTSISITNNTDSGRIFSFNGLSANEYMTIDNQRQIITSNSGLMRISKFNKNWFRLLPGINSLTIVGGISSYSIAYTPFKKVGG